MTYFKVIMNQYWQGSRELMSLKILKCIQKYKDNQKD